jgi:hypothetical protein
MTVEKVAAEVALASRAENRTKPRVWAPVLNLPLMILSNL